MSRNESFNQNRDLIDRALGSIEEPPKKMSKRMKNFQKSWLQEFPSWREWVVKLEDETKFYCKICNKTMLCVKSEIQNYEATVVHQKNLYFLDKMARYGLARESSEFNSAAHSAMDSFAENDSGVGFSNSTNAESCTFKEKVQGAEIRIATFFLEYNIFFRNFIRIVRSF